MSKKNQKILIMLIVIVILFNGFQYFQNNFSKAGILRKAINRKGYIVFELKKPVYFSGDIKPEWIPVKDKQEIKVKEEIGKIDQVSIILESVMHRGNDIYFNFDVIPYIKYSQGEFLYHNIINEDGTFTSYYSNIFKVYKGNQNIDVGQTGTGPDSKFSFGIDIDYYEQIKAGFTFDYTGGILYTYEKQ